MILITDIGKDIDDAVALTYAIISKIPIKCIITTSKDAIESAKICKNILNNLADQFPVSKNINIYSGSTEPLKKHGINHSNTYKGPFSKGDFDFDKFDPLKIKKDDAISIAGLTDLSKLMENKRIKRVMFMGQARKDRESLLPDMDAYNFKCDPFASEVVFQFQESVPFGFIGKNLAYRVPFTRDDFIAFEETGHPVGKFLKDHAFKTFEFFKNNVPELYERVYRGTNNISYCYDPLTVLAIKHPELFLFEKFGKHRIGVDIQADKAKENLMKTIIKGLK